MSVTDEMIAAFADGGLREIDKARVEAAMAADPTLARKVAAHRALKARLAAHYAPLAEQPMPAHLTELLTKRQESSSGGAEVVSFAAERQKRGLVPLVRRWGPIAGPALAATLVLALLQPWQGGAPEGYAGQRLAAALNTQLVSTQPIDTETRILLTFERKAGGLCRAWRDTEVGGIACRDNTGWKIERQFALDDAQQGQFRQAGSDADLLATAQKMALGGALDAAAERAAQERGWQK